MADVIWFSPRRIRVSARPQEGEVLGEIVFFTGVRYQRMPETVSLENGGGRPTTGGGVKRKRKRG